jgi:hypothetical protein
MVWTLFLLPPVGFPLAPVFFLLGGGAWVSLALAIL